jgi:hypothetical protein
MIYILNSVFTIVLYEMNKTRSHLYICFKKFLNQLNLLCIFICLYLQRELMSRIISRDHSLDRKDILKFILLFHDPIWVR